jgi:oxepin-CoA hydrolase/3-oxo-5,6-dehydrosuberyl-CoA semialdehyde dehydrogenase
MTAIPLNVNDNKLREMFFDRLLPECIASLDENARPIWGKMTPQHMVEHLVWTFEGSTGVLDFPCRTPKNMIVLIKKILYDERPLPRNYRNPLLDADPLPFRFPEFPGAKTALSSEIVRFVDHFREQPDAVHVHPVFGPLGAEEWQRIQFKHAYHHLVQFGLVQAAE